MKKLNAVGCNVFAGGFTVGVRKHFDVLAHLEHDSYGAEVVRRNLPGVQLYSDRKTWPQPDFFRRHDVKFVYANPPCAPFSVAAGARAARVSWDQDPRLERTHDAVGLLAHRPEVLASESVVAGWTKGEAMWREKWRSARGVGYSLTVLLHDAQYLGVPQRRARVFFVFHRVALVVPEPEWGRVTTVREARRGLKVRAVERNRWSVKSQHGALLAEARPGETLFRAYERLYKKPKLGDRGQRVGSPGFLTKRVPIDAPSCVILGAGKMHHPTEPRLLYPSEAQRLVTFPDNWQWPERCSRNSAMDLMSRGVAPKVGEWIARAARLSIEGGERVRAPRMAVLDYRRPPGTFQVVEGPGAGPAETLS